MIQGTTAAWEGCIAAPMGAAMQRRAATGISQFRLLKL